MINIIVGLVLGKTSAATPFIAGLLATYKSYDKGLNSKNVMNLFDKSHIKLTYLDRDYKVFILPKIGENIMEDKFKNEPEWAKEALKWALENKISDCDRLDDNVTRRELIVMLYRFFNMYQ